MKNKQAPDIKKRVLFLTRLFYPHVGGVEKHVFELSNELKKKNYNVTIITERYKSALKEKDEYKGIKIYRIPTGGRVWLKKFVIWGWFLTHLDLFFESDVIHAHDVFFWILPFRPFLIFKPIFTTFHGYEEFPVRKRTKFVRKISEHLSNGNICVGKFMAKWYGTKANVTIYGGTHLDKGNPKPKKDLSSIFFGRLDSQTSVMEYVKAASLIKEKIPKFTLTIFGDGVLRDKVPKDFVIKAFDPSIDKSLIEYKYIFVSRYLSMLEAFASKRIVFALYDNPLKEDYLKISPFSKFIIIAGSPEELSKRVVHIIKNPSEEKRLVSEAYEWAKKQSWEQVANSYIQLWNRKT